VVAELWALTVFVEVESEVVDERAVGEGSARQ